MQTHGRVPCVFKRSLSSGRDALESQPSQFEASATISIPSVNTSKLPFKCDVDQHVNDPSSLLSFDRNSILRRSMSRSRDQSTMHRRSISAIRSEFPSRLSYTGDLQSDYSSTKINDSQVNRYRSTAYSTILKPEYYSKLPLPTSKNHEPQKSPSNDAIESPMHRRSLQRGNARIPKRTDLYGSSSSINVTDDKYAIKARQDREHETQSVLREIRERSHDRACKLLSRKETQSLDVGSQIPVQKRDIDNSMQTDQRKSSIPNIRINVDEQNELVHHTRTERDCEIDNSTTPNVINLTTAGDHRPDRNGFSRLGVEQLEGQSAAEFTDEILGELIRRSKEYSLESSELSNIDEKTTENSSLKKPKSKSKIDGKIKQKFVGNENKLANNDVVDEVKAITQDDVQSVTLPLPKSSKIARRMSQPQKEDSNDGFKLNTDKKVGEEANELNTVRAKSNETSVLAVDTKLYPKSKLTLPKEVTLKIKKASTSNATSTSNTRNAITAVMEKIIEKSTERLSPGKSITDKTKSDIVNGTSAPKPKMKKKIKVVKQSIQDDAQPPNESKKISPKLNGTSNETSPTNEIKSTEKKIKSGFLYSIGQKFEKMRENSKNKEREKRSSKSNETTVIATATAPTEECTSEVETVQTIIIPRIIKDSQGETIQKEEITIRQIDSLPKVDQRRSRIDAVIRNLRERSVPHTIRAENFDSDLATESALLKRAVSVEDMSNGGFNFNKGNVNKVLGLFRRIEKEQQIQKQQSLPAYHCEVNAKERPHSGGYVSKIKKSHRPYYTGAKSDTIISLTDHFERQYLNEKANQTLSNSKIPFLRSIDNAGSIPDTNEIHATNYKCTANCKNERKEAPASYSDENNRINKSNEVSLINVELMNNEISEKERIRNNRKGLVLDLTNEQYDDHFKKNSITDGSNNNNNSYNFNASDKRCSSSSNENQVNNNFTGNGNYYPYYAHSHSHSHAHSHGHSDRNSEALTPAYEMNTSYSSDNRSLHDDCESTSTFLSPTEEPELSAFDNWSACSGLFFQKKKLVVFFRKLCTHLLYFFCVCENEQVQQTMHRLYIQSI